MRTHAMFQPHMPRSRFTLERTILTFRRILMPRKRTRQEGRFLEEFNFHKKCTCPAQHGTLCRFVMRAAAYKPSFCGMCNYFVNYYTLLNIHSCVRDATGIKTQDVGAFAITQLSLIVHVCRKDRHYATRFRTM